MKVTFIIRGLGVVFVLIVGAAVSTIQAEMKLRPRLHPTALCHICPAGTMEVCPVCLIGDLNNVVLLRYGIVLAFELDLKLPELINVLIYMLHEVTSYATRDSLGKIIGKKQQLEQWQA